MTATIPFCEEYDQLVMFIVCSASHNDPVVKVDLARDIRQSRGDIQYCENKKAIWSDVVEQMIKDNLLVKNDAHERGTPPTLSLQPNIATVDCSMIRGRFPWIQDFFQNTEPDFRTSECMSKIVDYLTIRNATYVLPCSRGTQPSSIPSFISTLAVPPSPEGQKYLDFIAMFVKNVSYLPNPQSFTMEEAATIFNVDGKCKDLVFGVIKRMVSDNILVRVDYFPQRTYKVFNLLKAKGFNDHKTSVWLENADDEDSWNLLAGELAAINGKGKPFTQGDLVKLFGPEIGTRYEVLQNGYKAKVTTEIMDEFGSVVLPSIEPASSHNGLDAFKEILDREKFTLARALSVDGNDTGNYNSKGNNLEALDEGTLDFPLSRPAAFGFDRAVPKDIYSGSKRKRIEHSTSPLPEQVSRTGPSSSLRYGPSTSFNDESEALRCQDWPSHTFEQSDYDFSNLFGPDMTASDVNSNQQAQAFGPSGYEPPQSVGFPVGHESATYIDTHSEYPKYPQPTFQASHGFTGTSSNFMPALHYTPNQVPSSQTVPAMNYGPRPNASQPLINQSQMAVQVQLLQPTSDQFFTDPLKFYNSSTSQQPFPDPTQYPMLLNVQMDIQAWFLNPYYSGLGRFLNAGCSNKNGDWNEFHNLLRAVTGLSRETVLYFMLDACQSELSSSQSNKQATKADKLAISKKAFPGVLSAMRVPWKVDLGCQTWLKIALAAYATFAISYWKSKVKVRIARYGQQYPYVPPVEHGHVTGDTGLNAWSLPSVQAPAHLRQA